MAKRTKYVDADYVEKVEFYLYNNLPLPDIIDDTVPSQTYDPKVAETLAKPGEVFCQVPDVELNHIVVSNLGRVINTGTKKQLTPTITRESILIYASSEKIVLEEIFDGNLWDFDLSEIHKNYLKYNWKFMSYL